jgi:hypothetical protein
MSAIKSAEDWNQPRRRFSNTGAMAAEVGQLAFVRGAVASSIRGRARALVLSGLLTCAVAAQADKKLRFRGIVGRIGTANRHEPDGDWWTAHRPRRHTDL